LEKSFSPSIGKKKGDGRKNPIEWIEVEMGEGKKKPETETIFLEKIRHWTRRTTLNVKLQSNFWITPRGEKKKGR